MKLVQDIINKTYELTYLVPGDLLDAEVSALKKDITDLVAKQQGSIVKEDDWGRKQMAYKISQNGKTYAEAVYMHMQLTLPVTHTQALDRELSLHPQVLRHLLVVADAE